MSATILTMAQVRAARAARARCERIADIVDELEQWEPDARRAVVATYLLEGWAYPDEIEAALAVMKQKEQMG